MAIWMEEDDGATGQWGAVGSAWEGGLSRAQSAPAIIKSPIRPV